MTPQISRRHNPKDPVSGFYGILCMQHDSYTSGKNFIKITSVGMGAAKRNKVGMVMSVNSGT